MEWINDNRYTCPILMYLQSLIKRNQFWRYGSDGWRLMETKSVVARCMWSKRLIIAESKFWQSRNGFRLKLWCGHQQREQRLKLYNKLDDLLEEKEVLDGVQIVG